MRIVAIVQARMSSTRLPGKVLAEIDGSPMLMLVVERVGRADRVDLVVVATSSAEADDPIAQLCDENGIDYYRGSECDVLDRFYQAAAAHHADLIVRVTADCPLIDSSVIDEVIEKLIDERVDYASNIIRPTYPDGLDSEVFTRSALERAWKEATKPYEREHVTPYLRFSDRFTTANVEQSEDLSELRWTVDEPSDLEFIKRVYEGLGSAATFGFREVLSLLRERPDLDRDDAGIIMNEGYYRSLYAEARAGSAPRRSLEESVKWLARARQTIPGCAQTFSKGYTQYVQGVSPIFLRGGKGCRVWDVDGNEYIDYVQGLLPNILGYAHDEVNAAAAAQYAEGHSFSLPHPLEIELAERLIQIIPCAEMVRFGKNGSDATSGAIRAARAVTSRDRVACCGYHGWQDWYIGSTARSAGVPEAVRSLTHPFAYNDLTGLETILQAHPGEFAAVIMEPVNFYEPDPGFLEGVKELAHRHGALLIFDEICTGFRFGLGGAQKKYGVVPDMACFGKAMGNGYPISCVAGRAEVMNIFAEIFFSFTFAGEVASMAAAMKVLDLLESTDALSIIQANGRRLQDGFNTLAKLAGLADRFVCIGQPNWSLMKFLDSAGKDSFLERSLFQQEAAKRGILMLATHNMCAAHDNASTEQTLEAYSAIFKTLAGWLSEPDPALFLEGSLVQPVFRVR